MRQKMTLFAVLVLTAVLSAVPALAQNVVQYSGKLQIGFSDADNNAGTNDAIPVCAVVNPFAQHTIGTLLVNGQANATAAGPGAALTFDAVGVGNGGAQIKNNATCNVAIPGFLNPRLRSRTQVGAAKWPGNKGAFTTMYTTAPEPATPTATYMVSANGGNQAAFFSTVPFLSAGGGSEAAVPGPNKFGGAIPYQGGGGVQLGVNFATTFGGVTLVPGDYGKVLYANGFLPTEPQLFGTDYKGVALKTPATTTTYANGVIVGRQDLSFAARTVGGSTVFDQGAIQTLGGGNTATPAGGPGNTGPLIASPVAFQGVFGEWTTGMVTHTDRVGDFTTIRATTGFDVATTGPNGTTRKLQLVTPWGASIRAIGPFGLPLPDLGFGGIGKLNINIIPVPEPGTLAMLGFGVAGLLGLGAAKRRNG